MKVFVNKMIPEIGMNLLKQAGLEVILPENENLTQEEWLQYCRSVDVILSIGNDFKYDKNFLIPARISKRLLCIL